MAALFNRQYCRGCKCMVDEACFRDDGEVYKQCDRCRGRVHDRTRSCKMVTCECGKQVLTSSLRDHLRTLFHEQYLVGRALLPANNKGAAEVVDRRVAAVAANSPKPALVQFKFKVKEQPINAPREPDNAHREPNPNSNVHREPANASKAPTDAPKLPINAAKPASSAMRLAKAGSIALSGASSSYRPTALLERHGPSAHNPVSRQK